MPKIDEYIPIVGEPVIEELKLLAKKLEGKSVQHINSTSVGGGVAEILNRMVPLLRELGVDTRWDVIKGGKQFFDVTKKFHNALHGKNIDITDRDFEIFDETTKMNLEEVDTQEDIIFVHDPQPVGLIKKKKDNKWIWRCHIDVSNPNKKVWNFLEPHINQYDASVFSSPHFSQKLSVRQFLVAPSIDPLSDKNRELSQNEIDTVLRKYDIIEDKPILTQISRFDRLKDPVGVIESYKLVKKYNDCQLILAGGVASDDPEGQEVLEEVKNAAEKDPDIHIILLPQNDIEVNALQTASTIIIQKSLKEGFGLTVSEALWKSKPVVASNVGGIPLQVKDNFSGLLSHSIPGTAFKIKKLLNNAKYAKRLGENGKEHVRKNFLLTRHLRDYMLLFLSLYHKEDLNQI